MAKEALFREKSMDRIASPDQMRDYLRVTNPRLWLLLGAMIVMLAGFVIYAASATMESTCQMKMEFYASEYITGIIPYDRTDNISVGMPVRIAGETGSVTDLHTKTQILLTMYPESDSRAPEPPLPL